MSYKIIDKLARKISFDVTAREHRRRQPTKVKNPKIASNIHRMYVKWFIANEDLLPKAKGKMFRRATKRRLALGRV